MTLEERRNRLIKLYERLAPKSKTVAEDLKLLKSSTLEKEVKDLAVWGKMNTAKARDMYNKALEYAIREAVTMGGLK